MTKLTILFFYFYFILFFTVLYVSFGVYIDRHKKQDTNFIHIWLNKLTIILFYFLLSFMFLLEYILIDTKKRTQISYIFG